MIEKLIAGIIETLGVTDLLDYGDGSWFKNLKVRHSMRLQAGKDGVPMQMVTCLTPADEELEKLKALTQAVGVFCLSDKIETWMPKLVEHFDVQTVQKLPEGYYSIVYSRPRLENVD